MFRRRFLQLVTVATAGSLSPLKSLANTSGKVVTYHVKGFSCITCATGLDTMLGQQKGIVSSKSTYPEGMVTVRFEPEQTTEKAIVAFITELGFSVESNVSQKEHVQPRPRK
jgi:copper chaperone CopZ